MKTISCRVVWILPWLIASSSASAEERHCRAVEAHGIGQDEGGGVTQAQITGSPLLRGSTQAQFSIISVQGSVAIMVGTVVFTVRGGTLTVGMVGTFNLASGAFVALSTKITGTGRMEAMRGQLRFDGVEDLSTGQFTETIRGELCRCRDDDEL